MPFIYIPRLYIYIYSISSIISYLYTMSINIYKSYIHHPCIIYMFHTFSHHQQVATCSAKRKSTRANSPPGASSAEAWPETMGRPWEDHGLVVNGDVIMGFLPMIIIIFSNDYHHLSSFTNDGLIISP